MVSQFQNTENLASSEKKYSVLITDDETANIAVLNRILSDEYTIFTAKSSEQCLRVAAEQRPNLILLDVLMPDADGFFTLAKLRENEATAAIPVIFITALTSPEDEEKGFALGAVDYIYKPFKPIVIKARVHTQIHAANKMSLIENNFTIAFGLVDDSQNIAIFFNNDDRIEYINAAAEIITGYPREVFYQSGLAPILGDKEWRNFREEYLHATRTLHHLKFQMPIYRKDNIQRWLTMSSSLLTLRDGRTGVGITASDDTDAEILYRDLSAAKKQLETALQTSNEYNQRKNALFLRISHEVRAPLNAIINIVDTLKAADNDQRGLLLDKVTASSYNLLHTIDEMLDITQLSMNTFSIVQQPCDLHALLNLTRETVSPRIAAANVTFTAQIAENLPRYVITDEKRLQQLLFIFLDNAIRYTPAGGEISLGAEMLERQGVAYILEFTITDSGAGIPQEVQNSHCDAFEIIANIPESAAKGLGLGIAIAKLLVRFFNGKIQIDSSAERGTTVKFTIKADVCAPLTDGRFAANDLSFLSGKRILLVDDLEMNREVATIFLGSAGATIDEVESGEQAVHKFTSSPPYDVVLMDLHLPDIDGYEVVRQMRSSSVENAPSVPIIALSADVGGEIIKRCFYAGMDAHIAKPVNRQELVHTLARLLGKK